MKSVFCMRLNTAGVVFGWLGISAYLFYTIIVIGSFGMYTELARYVMDEIETWDLDMDLNFSEVRSHINFYLVACCVDALIGLLSSILLVLGTLKNRHLLLLPWLVLTVVELIGLIASMSILTYVGFDEITDLSNPIIYVLIGFFALTVLESYAFFGIYALFKEIKLSRQFKKGNTLTI